MTNKLYLYISLYLTLCSFLLPLSSQEQQKAIPEIGYSFNLRWRLGAPVFLREEFPVPLLRQHQPTLFTGGMTPRGSFFLRHKGDLAVTPADQQRVLRSKTVDITSLITVVGAQHSAADGKITNYTAAQLPTLKVIYEPEMPAEITLPSEVGTVVLLWQIGEGKEDDWDEGYWRVHLRFDARSLNIRLRPNGSGAEPDPKLGRINSVVLFSFDFNAKKIKTDDDRLNLLLFKFYDDKAKGDYVAALASLNPILGKYPNDGPLLLERSFLYSDYLNNSPAALADAKQLLKFTEEKKLRRMFRPPLSDRHSTREEAVEWLKQHIQFLEQPAAGATLPAPAKPQ